MKLKRSSYHLRYFHILIYVISHLWSELTIKPEISSIKSWIDGEEVTLSCTSPGTCLWRTPKITWRGNIQNTIVENQVKTHKNVTKTHFSTITFTARKEQNNSTLLCIVQLKRGLTVAQQITMRVKSKHKNISEVKSYCTITGNHIECTCIVQSFPEASIRWKIDDQFYYSSKENIHISTSRSALVINSTLSLQLSQKDIPYIKCISSNNYGELVLDLLYKKSSMDYKVIVGMVTGNLIILLLIALGIFWYLKRHMKKDLGNNDMHELSNTRGAESVYQDLQRPTNSIYNTITK
ncbi:neural cell adhesion molecule 1-like isoform X2 [Aquarana catesbeiana]|uniref:neural cell adhesion molecule 1-like isoform X2 n=1 Tax=Aquarana catesbeiana TaxID=8400 RepID=UPI003CCA5310